MRLQKRLFAMVMGIQLIFILLMSITTNYRTMQAFTSIEQRFFTLQMSGAQKAVNNESHSLQNSISDWGAWDRMYAFMETKDVSRFEELLNGSILRALNIDFIAVLDTDLKPIVAYRVDEIGNELPLDDEMLDTLHRSAEKMRAAQSIDAMTPDVFDPEESASPSSDLLKLGDDVFLFKSAQILTTDWGGPARGMVVAGRNFNRVLEDVSSSLGAPCQFLPVSSDAANPTGVASEDQPLVIVTREDNTAFVQQPGRPILGTDTPYALAFVMPRDIYAEGQRAMYNSYVWLFYSGISLAILMVYFLSRVILKRLNTMRGVFTRIIHEVNFDLRFTVTRQDEIGDFAGSVNVLLDTLEHVIMQIPDALIINDASGRVVFLNLEARRLLNRMSFSRETDTIFVKDILSRTESKLLGPTSDQFVYEGVFRREDGSTVPVELHKNTLSLGPQRVVLYLARDLTERHNLAARIDWNDHHDAYTGLPNRKSFVDTLNRLLKADNTIFGKSSAQTTPQPLTLVIINMDHFKSINAEVTNTGGDIILAVIAERIKNALEERGALFRTSGDEFSILFTKDEDGKMISPEELVTLLSKIRDDVSLPCQMGERVVHPSASMGVLFDALSYDNSSLIIEKATTALKAAKGAGLGLITIYKEKEDGGEVDASFAANILRMRYEIREGIEQEQFIPYFQPVYDIKERRLSGFETLVRWQHPTRGFLTPYHFVPYAERIGVIGEIDRHMMQCAMKAIADSPAPYYFSANGSSNLMQQANAADLIYEMLDRAKIDSSRFVTEVTESVLIDNLTGVQKALKKLGTRNVRIFLDDFGTGYSSLEYLHALPFNCIKLDQSFVRRVFDSEQDAKMLHAIINLANALEMDTIAEGVETEEQLVWLGEAGCRKAQGYFFAKPLPWVEADALIKREYARLLADEAAAGGKSAE
ncbi:EAL domain-containing protein [uncultured Fretibacterium sp.]|uniref:bifunctional diguanylate cyclase/phosphodiesterase n=1 Tax=uncultured Fretibacterium sp. TaxID=1678694 RepID=UPI00260A75FF|nr:EAL domain-containing protein [uncultured Fretibacterium sp.]